MSAMHHSVLSNHPVTHLWTSTYSTVRHILLDCVDLQDVRRRHFSVTCLRDLFETVDNRIVIDFIKDIRFYRAMH